jgi:hypothetical protein
MNQTRTKERPSEYWKYKIDRKGSAARMGKELSNCYLKEFKR